MGLTVRFTRVFSDSVFRSRSAKMYRSPKVGAYGSTSVVVTYWAAVRSICHWGSTWISRLGAGRTSRPTWKLARRPAPWSPE